MGKKRKFPYPDPRANMNIGEISKTHSTGPRTVMGKLRASVGSGQMQTGRHSKILEKIRKCPVCPFGPKVTKAIMKDGNVVDVPVPPTCKFYRDGKQSCIVDPVHYIKKLRVFFEIGEKLGTKELHRKVIYDMLEGALINADVDLIKKGKISFETQTFYDRVGKQIEAYNKLLYGEKHIGVGVAVEGDAAERIMDRMLKNDVGK